MQGEDHLRDGAIDFSGYSTGQLRDLQFTVDRSARPLDFQNLQTELARRTRPTEEHADITRSWNATFTRRSGLRGWLEAKTKRLGVYGTGSVAIEGNELLLRGWGRTWLGVPCRLERSVPLNSILNLVQEERTIRFVVPRWKLRKRYEFGLDSADSAARLAAALPGARTPGFEREWRELHEFNRRLPPSGTGTWVTKTLVAANCAVFIAMAIALRRVVFFSIPQLLHWGANFGPLTASGQWWRLLTSAFIHLSPLHLLINMWALWHIGRLTERLLGRWPFATLYFVCAVLSSLGSIAWDPSMVSAGASGAIFGIFGVFLAFLTKRRARVPKAIIRPHLTSTTVFVLFSLVSGALQSHIDNAAHVSGLLVGLCLGWIIARPMRTEAPRAIGRRRIAAATAFLLAVAVAGLGEAGGIDFRPPVAQQYFQSHLWYFEGESRDLKQWERLVVQAQIGSITTDQLTRQFKETIIPFWRSAYRRLQKETLPPSQRQLGRLVAKFVDLRLRWAQAIVAAVSNGGKKSYQKVARLSRQTDLARARAIRVSLLSTAAHSPPGLVNSAIVEHLRGLFSSGPKCVLPPPTIAAPVGPHAPPTDFPATRRTRECAAQRAFEHHDFSTLAKVFRTPGTRSDFPVAASAYADAVSGLDHLLEYGHGTVLGDLRVAAAWHRAEPDSSVPGLIDAMIFEQWAWTARGGGYVNSVSKLAWQAYHARVAMAAASLRAAGKSARSTPLWYQVSMWLEIDQGGPLGRIRATFNQGIERFPQYLPLYRQMLRALMPRWFGSYSKINAFIMRQYYGAPPQIDTELYTRLYWLLARLSGDTVDIFKSSDVGWTAMKAGFQRMRRRYPHSDYVLNVFANFACRANDKAEYRALRPDLSARYASSAWSTKYSMKKCDGRMGIDSPAMPAAAPTSTASHR